MLVLSDISLGNNSSKYLLNAAITLRWAEIACSFADAISGCLNKTPSFPDFLPQLPLMVLTRSPLGSVTWRHLLSLYQYRYWHDNIVIDMTILLSTWQYCYRHDNIVIDMTTSFLPEVCKIFIVHPISKITPPTVLANSWPINTLILTCILEQLIVRTLSATHYMQPLQCLCITSTLTVHTHVLYYYYFYYYALI